MSIGITLIIESTWGYWFEKLPFNNKHVHVISHDRIYTYLILEHYKLSQSDIHKEVPSSLAFVVVKYISSSIAYPKKSF